MTELTEDDICILPENFKTFEKPMLIFRTENPNKLKQQILTSLEQYPKLQERNFILTGDLSSVVEQRNALKYENEELTMMGINMESDRNQLIDVVNNQKQELNQIRLEHKVLVLSIRVITEQRNEMLQLKERIENRMIELQKLINDPILDSDGFVREPKPSTLTFVYEELQQLLKSEEKKDTISCDVPCCIECKQRIERE